MNVVYISVCVAIRIPVPVLHSKKKNTKTHCKASRKTNFYMQCGHDHDTCSSLRRYAIRFGYIICILDKQISESNLISSHTFAELDWNVSKLFSEHFSNLFKHIKCGQCMPFIELILNFQLRTEKRSFVYSFNNKLCVWVCLITENTLLGPFWSVGIGAVPPWIDSLYFWRIFGRITIFFNCVLIFLQQFQLIDIIS